MKTTLPNLLVVGAILTLAAGCVNIRHTIDPIEINLNVKLESVDKELDTFFSDLDASNNALK